MKNGKKNSRRVSTENTAETQFMRTLIEESLSEVLMLYKGVELWDAKLPLVPGGGMIVNFSRLLQKGE